MATDPLSLVFIGCFLVGALFLGVSSLFGGGHHAGHAGSAAHTGHVAPVTHSAPGLHATPSGIHTSAHSVAPAATHTGSAAPPSATGFHMSALLDYLSPLSLMTFLTLFGLTGYVLHNYTTLALVLILILALLLGLGVVALTFRLLDRLIGADAGVLSSRSSQLVGMLARVSTPIRAGGVGEVIYLAEQGTRHGVGARSADGSEIPRDTEVVIVDYRNGIAYVQEWNAFLYENTVSNQRPVISDQSAPPFTVPNERWDGAESSELKTES
jgi:membrane protein implicated in regulation of membrane protease activity